MWLRRKDGLRDSFFWATLVVLSFCVVSGLLELTPASLVHWHYILQRAFYVPVIIGALVFGWRGGLISAGVATLCYFAFTKSPQEATPYLRLDNSLEGMMFFVVGGITGVFADRQRQHRQKLQQNAEQLANLYTELQKSFEGMKRTERLSALGQLAAGLAHELRNPLASIEGAATVVQREPYSEQRRTEFLSIIEKECHRLDRLITDFLEFARPHAPEFMPTDIALVLDSVIVLASHALNSQCIALRKRVSENMPPIECDPEQLKQVLLNLVLNAIQAMPFGGEITLSTEIELGQAVIQIKDQGSGIETDHLERIFDPFFTTKPDGTGLGLAVAHQIIEQHGGSVVASRNSDKGMTFAVKLPLQPASRL
jgi:signal transduction histidine kinase